MPEQTTLRERILQEEEQRERRYKRRSMIIPIVLLLLAAGIWLLTGLLLRRTAQSRMEDMIGRAHTFALVEQQWEERGHEPESGIYCVKNDAGDLEDYLVYYFEDARGDYFGLKLDDNGDVLYTMYSKKEIPEEYLDTPPDYDGQYALLRSLFGFRRKQAVAVWDAQETDGEDSNGV